MIDLITLNLPSGNTPKDADARAVILNKRTDVIPDGHYCYTYVNNEYISCPYAAKSKKHREQESGYCSFLQYGDWENQDVMTLLWDGVKECGKNTPQE